MYIYSINPKTAHLFNCKWHSQTVPLISTSFVYTVVGHRWRYITPSIQGSCSPSFSWPVKQSIHQSNSNHWLRDRRLSVLILHFLGVVCPARLGCGCYLLSSQRQTAGQSSTRSEREVWDLVGRTGEGTPVCVVDLLIAHTGVWFCVIK